MTDGADGTDRTDAPPPDTGGGTDPEGGTGAEEATYAFPLEGRLTAFDIVIFGPLVSFGMIRAMPGYLIGPVLLAFLVELGLSFALPVTATLAIEAAITALFFLIFSVIVVGYLSVAVQHPILTRLPPKAEVDRALAESDLAVLQDLALPGLDRALKYSGWWIWVGVAGSVWTVPVIVVLTGGPSLINIEFLFWVNGGIQGPYEAAFAALVVRAILIFATFWPMLRLGAMLPEITLGKPFAGVVAGWKRTRGIGWTLFRGALMSAVPLALVQSIDIFLFALTSIPLLSWLPLVIADGIVWFGSILGDALVIHAFAFTLAVVYRMTEPDAPEVVRQATAPEAEPAPSPVARDTTAPGSGDPTAPGSKDDPA